VDGAKAETPVASAMRDRASFIVDGCSFWFVYVVTERMTNIPATLEMA
jgi:hypothetical protein